MIKEYKETIKDLSNKFQENDQIASLNIKQLTENIQSLNFEKGYCYV